MSRRFREIDLLPQIAILVGILTAGGVAFTYGYWIGIVPQQWRVLSLIFIPIMVAHLVASVPVIWWIAKRRITQQEEPDHLEKFVVSVEYIDKEWHEPLERAEGLLDRCDDLFSKINGEVGPRYSDLQEPKNVQFQVACEMTADCLRVADSVLSQIRAGHPDTAMGTTRQLFELRVILDVISLDKTGERAKKYQDFNELRYLTDYQDTASTKEEKESIGKRIAAIKRRYRGKIDFRKTYGWSGVQGEMRELLDYLEKEYGADSGKRREAALVIARQWIVLTNWSHISKAASMRKLGTRTGSGYLRALLVEKSKVGLDVPMSIATGSIFEILCTYADIGQDITGIEHGQELDELYNLVKDVASAIKSVPAELRANDFSLRFRDQEEENDC